MADAPRHRVKFDDRVLAESAAAWEQIAKTPIDDRLANAQARGLAGDFERRLVHRAASLSIASQLTDALRHVRSGIGLIVLASMILATLGGAAATRTALGTPRDEPVNFYHVVAATLLPQTILLLAWLCVMVLPRSAGAVMSLASLGGIVMRLGQWLTHRIHPGIDHAAAVVGISRSLVAGKLGRWTFSSISHALWLAFNIGCLGMMIFLLSTRQYAFAWETTILSERTYRPLTSAIAAVPRAAGFAAPNDEQIEASMWSGGAFMQEPAASQAWSSLLVGSVIVYGLLPRLLLMMVTLGQRRYARTRYRIDVDRPDYARLRNVLEPDVTSRGIIDGEQPANARIGRAAIPPHSESPRDMTRKQPAATGATGEVHAIIGFELPVGNKQHHWPPKLHGVRWHDVGMIDSREDRQRAVADLMNVRSPLASVVIVCSLTTTPDRGVSAFLGEVVASVASTPVLVLTGGQHMRERASGVDVEVRINDWRLMAQAAGIRPHNIVEADLDHFTRASQAKLAHAIGSSPVEHRERMLEEAFDLIVDAVQKHEHSPQEFDHAAQSRLIQDMARLHGDEQMTWRDVLQLPANASAFTAAGMAEHLKSGAQRFTELLPARLRSSPKWLAAGATAGAIGCVAAAALISPIAIGSLPIWSGIGAAVSAAINMSRSAQGSAVSCNSGSGGDFSASVRAVALFAMLLELQRFDEGTITRVLDQAIEERDGAQHTMNDARHVQIWLDELRHRFDIAVAKEVRS